MKVSPAIAIAVAVGVLVGVHSADHAVNDCKCARAPPTNIAILPTIGRSRSSMYIAIPCGVMTACTWSEWCILPRAPYRVDVYTRY
jgi:hypothetical protein